MLKRTSLLRYVVLVVGILLLTAGSLAVLTNFGSRQAPAPVDFNRDIRPILTRSCTKCHGGVRQKSGVSFVYREMAMSKGDSGRPVIVPGHPEKSELIARVTATDDDRRMPHEAPPLTPQQIELLRQWIKEGAQWEDHWAFEPPRTQAMPDVQNVAWIRRPLDRFVLARLEQERVVPSPEASKAELLRRVSFDLTGLPPAPADLEAFLADESPDAYEKQVERLLSSPHYGERWAALWLDLARYADSRGYEQDRNRSSWPYRDWVIDAFNRNVPYDRFVITQLAGDLLPNATFEDRIATSFQRQTLANDEAGTDDEEFRLMAVMDRVATTWSVLNGVTINCVQCHAHPYDPIGHTEYYKFLAFYNTSRDADLVDESPTLPFPKDHSRLNELEYLERQRGRLAQEILRQAYLFAEQSRWVPLPIATGMADQRLGLERSLMQLERNLRRPISANEWGVTPKQIRKGYEESIATTKSELNHIKRSTHVVSLEIDRGEALALGTIPSRSVFQLTTEPIPSMITALRIEVSPQDSGKARHTPEDGFIVDRIDAWVISPSGNERKIEFHLFIPDSEDNLEKSSNDESDAEFSANPKLFQQRWIIAVPQKAVILEVGTRLKVQLTQTKDISAKPAVVRRVRLSISQDNRWLDSERLEPLKSKLSEYAAVRLQMSQIPSVSVPVMAEQATYEQRQTLEFERGNFLTKVGPVLSPDVPKLFPPLPKNAFRNRLTMAQWFFTPDQPLTSRVAVNRYWEQLFGVGLVETLEDFGSTGQVPSHPELLDWLALHFQNDLRWDMKALLRELVTSSTYRQTAHMSRALLEKDLKNHLLARGPRQRLTAEMVRDQALVASGLLNPAIGGPPVMPPQPAGMWNAIANFRNWVDATGPDRYRRAIYTYRKRSAIYPSFLIFDASEHVVSLARRIPTNTPLQALVTLNDPVYAEAAEALARQMLTNCVPAAGQLMQAGSPTDEQVLEARLNCAARRVLSHDLMPEDRKAFASLYDDVRKKAEVSEGQLPTAESQAIGEFAGLTAVAAAFLNLDAALTR